MSMSLTTVKVLTDDSLLNVIFSYLPNHYRFIAPVCHNFQRNYLETHDGNSTTTWASALQTASTAQIWLCEVAILNSRSYMDIAARYGTLEVLEWLQSKGCDCSIGTCTWAARRGHLKMLQWARSNGCPWNEETCKEAAWNGHLEVLKWARDNGCPWHGGTYEAAVWKGHLDIVKWAQKNGCPWSNCLCYHPNLFANNPVEVMKITRRCTMEEWTSYAAAWMGHLEILKWSRNNGGAWNDEICYFAATNGHLNILKWARENGCPWNAATCYYAAISGHLNVLKWARANGCDWNPDLIILGATNPDVLTWVHCNR